MLHARGGREGRNVIRLIILLSPLCSLVMCKVIFYENLLILQNLVSFAMFEQKLQLFHLKFPILWRQSE